MTYRKKLIEVALPLEAINKAAAREKSIRHGHPSTLHLWWARRPLAACRAVLFASLVDDPDSDPAYRKADGTVDEERAGEKRAELFNLIEELVQWENSNNPTVINAARAEIARCVASRKLETGELKKDAVVYEKPGDRRQKTGGRRETDDHHSDSRILTSGSAPAGPKTPRSWGPPDKTITWDLVTMNARPEAVNAFLAEHAPPVLDPFCGGGSIPLEAQRLGLRAYGSDLNPVPVLITKALIEIPPKFAGKPPVNPSSNAKLKGGWTGAQGLAEDVRYYGKWMRDEAEKRIGHLYPKVKITKEMTKDRSDLKPLVGEELTVIAWLWARTVTCSNPACSGTTPLAKTFQISAKRGNEAYTTPIIHGQQRTVSFHVSLGNAKSSEGTVNRRGATCLFCKQSVNLDHIRDQAQAGLMGQVMLGIVVEGSRKRIYLSPTAAQIEAAMLPSDRLACFEPATELPKQALGFRVQRYGMTTHGSLFTRRQLVALTSLADLVKSLTGTASPVEADESYRRALATYLAFAVDKSANYWSSLCSWYVAKEIMVSTFGLPTLSMVWDFAEANPFSDSSGNWMLGVEQAASSLEKSPAATWEGNTSQLDATRAWPEMKGNPLVSTDPPYYDNIGYAALSDFFYVWLRYMLGAQYPQLFSTMLTPKSPELIAEPGRFDGDMDSAVKHFESGLLTAFERARTGGAAEYPTTVFYAFKQQENVADDDRESGSGNVASSGWEKMLTALIEAGFRIDGTWPMRTEQSGGLREAQRNSLASSIVLSCRPRSGDASLATRREFLNVLKRELPEALKNLQRGSIAPVDLAQAAIGPGMAVFTRYSKVMETDGSAMTVRTALGLINQALDEVLAEQEGEFDADTRWALAWFEQFGMEEGAFGVAETLSKAKNTAINGLVEAGVVKARAGKVRLLKRGELGSQETGDRARKTGDRRQETEWDPSADSRFTIWEATQYLIRALDKEGESGAAALLRKLGGTAEIARDLAYRLYTICERKKWADEALAYNGLVIAWPELTKLAMAAPKGKAGTQAELF